MNVFSQKNKAPAYRPRLLEKPKNDYFLITTFLVETNV